VSGSSGITCVRLKRQSSQSIWGVVPLHKTKIGVIGCGNISGIYLKNLKAYEHLEVVACADLDEDRAKAKAEEYGIPKAMWAGGIFLDPDVEIVLNLTVPRSHAAVCMRALEVKKHVHVEKPLAVEYAVGRRLMESANSVGLRVGAAPDTFMGGGLQTCRKLIDDGAIGAPIAATAFMLCHGHEGWHPDPTFYYQKGGGPMFDMGPYYLTALLSLLGPVRRVTGSTRIMFPERTITSAPKHGEKILVEVPTHVAGVLDFANGAMATIVTSFDVWAAQVPRMEIYGTEGTLSLPDPNTFGGPVRLRLATEKEWRDVPLTHGHTDNSRGIGVAEMAQAIQEGRPHRANGEMALHVLQIMEAIHFASKDGRHILLETTFERPEAMAAGI
jgi:predicted dehydrogenase